MSSSPQNGEPAKHLTALVVIVAYEAGEHLQRCVHALDNQTFQDWRAIIWDNASKDGAVDQLAASSKFLIVRSPENIGFAAANNRAAALIESRFIITLNPDAFAEPDWLDRLVSAAIDYGADAVGSLQLSASDPERLDGAGDCMSVSGIAWRGGFQQTLDAAPKRTAEIFAPCAAAALYRRDAFEREGGFDERYFCYFEDVDLGFRLRLSGGRCIIEPGAIVYHIGSASTKTISGFAEYHGTRNRLWCFLRNMPLVLMPAALPAHVLAMAYILARSPSHWSIRFRALKEALIGAKPFLEGRRRSGVAWLSVATALTWSPLSLRRRSVKARAIRKPAFGVRPAANPNGL